MHIVLIGYRGTGKTAVGKILADRLRLPFYDTDELVTQGAGQSIRTIIEERGWGYFRERECDVIRKLEVMQAGVVATGGGAVMDEGNCQVLKRHGLLIWLAADVTAIAHRIRADITSKEQRPSLSHGGICREAEDVLRWRIPIYRELADFSVDTTAKSIDEIVDTVYQFLERTGRIIRKEVTCQEIP